MQVLPEMAVYTRLCNDYRGMAQVQTNQMKATPAIYVPTLYDYNSHLIGCHRRHSAVGDKVWLARRAGLIIPPRRDLDVGLISTKLEIERLNQRRIIVCMKLLSKD